MKINLLKCLVIVVAVLLVGCAEARAATQLRYKFTPGEVSRYVITEDQNFMRIRQGEDAQGSITHNVIIDLTSKVDRVDGKGNASINLSIDRFRMTAKDPQEVLFDYDTASQVKPKGSNKIFALIYEVLTKQPITMKQSPLGKISDIKMPEEMKEAARKATTAAAQTNGTVPSEEELSDSLTKGIKIIFTKEPLDEGKTWSMDGDIKCYIRFGLEGGEGIKKIKTTFRYLGRENKDDKILDKISLTEELRSPGKIKVSAENVKVELKSLSTEGTIYFDNAAGLLVDYNTRSEMKFSVTTSDNGKQMNSDVVLTSVNTTKLVPADSKADNTK
ncbi:MAG TPA: DUF6263 family protein [Thermoguttaceae bacterium]